MKNYHRPPQHTHSVAYTHDVLLEHTYIHTPGGHGHTLLLCSVNQLDCTPLYLFLFSHAALLETFFFLFRLFHFKNRSIFFSL